MTLKYKKLFFQKSACFLITMLVILTSCRREQPIAQEDPAFLKIAEYFSNEKSYENPNEYRAKFMRFYKGYLNNEEYENAKLILARFGGVLVNSFATDSLFCTTAIQFIKKDYPVKKDFSYVQLHYLLASYYNGINDHQNALFWGHKASELNNQLSDKNLESQINSTLATAYVASNQPKKALPLYLQSVKYYEEIEDFSFLGSQYYNIANTYEHLHAYTESDKFYIKAAQNFKKANDTAYYFALKSTFITNRFGYTNDTLATLSGIDSLIAEFRDFKKPAKTNFSDINGLKSLKSYITKDYDSAFFYNDLAAAHFRETNNMPFVVYYDTFDAKIYFKKYGKIKDEQKIKSIAKDLLNEKSFFESLDLYHILYQNAKAQNKIEDALYYRNMEVALKDSTLRENQKGQLFEFEKKYELQKKEKEIAQQKAIIYKNNLFIVGLVGAILVLLLMSSLIVMRRRRVETQAEAKRQELFAFQLLQNTEEERSRIANDLHDSVNHELLHLKNNLINGKAIAPEDVANVIEEVRGISRNLNPSMLQIVGLEGSIENLCERLTELGLFTTCDISYTDKVSANKELQLYRIIQESLNNTLKHGQANAAKVTLVSTGDGLYLEVKDNGSGFNIEHQLKNAKSFGLQSIFQRAKSIAAKINIDSTNTGTIISIKIPL